MKRKQLLAMVLSATLVMGMAMPVYAEEGVASQAAMQSTTDDVTKDGEKDVVEKVEETPVPEESKPLDEEPAIEAQPKAEDKEEQLEVEDSKEVAQEEPQVERESLEENDIVTIPDPRVKQVILDTYDKDKDGQLTKAEMATVISFELWQKGTIPPFDLAGIEYCVNIKSLSITGRCQSLEPLKDLKTMDSLTLNITNAIDISAVKGMTSLTHFVMGNNPNSDISHLKDLTQLKRLHITSCNVKDISSLSNLRNLERLVLSHNQISDISVLSNFTKLRDVMLEDNKIVDISVLANLIGLQGVLLSGNSDLKDISVLQKHTNTLEGVKIKGNSNITKGYIFETFVNPNIEVIIGNEISLGMKFAKQIETDFGNLSESDITWKVENPNIVKLTDEYTLVGLVAGRTTIKGTIGAISKTFEVNVKELESQVVEVSKTTSQLEQIFVNVCAVLDSKKILWSIDKDKTEKVKSGVKSYTSVFRDLTQNEKTWGEYYVLDTNNNLWHCTKKSQDAAYLSDKIFSNVKRYNPEYVLLNDGTLYNIQDQKKPIGTNIEKYVMRYDATKGEVGLDDIILNKSKELVSQATGKVYLNNVDDVTWSGLGYLALSKNTLYIYQKEGSGLRQSDKVEAVEKLTLSGCVKKDGSVWILSKGQNESTIKLVKQWDSEPVYRYTTSDSVLVLDLKGVLHMFDGQGVLIWNKEHVKEAQQLHTDQPPYWGIRVIMNDGTFMEYQPATNDWKTIASNVKKMFSDYYITNENVLYQIRETGQHNKVLGDVRDITTRSRNGSVYIVRTDNSVWKYLDFESGNGIPCRVKEGDKPEDKPASPVDEVFKDVPVGQWFNDSVQFVYDNNIMTGLNSTNFGPSETLARAQFAVILYRLSGEPKIEYTPKFKDVPDGQWYTSAVLWANQAGIVTGYSSTGLFGTSDRINREQMAVMMYRYAKYQQYDTSQTADFSKFKDAASVNDFAKEAMRWAVGSGIITGKDNGTRIDPQGDANRAECATIIMRFMELYT